MSEEFSALSWIKLGYIFIFIRLSTYNSQVITFSFVLFLGEGWILQVWKNNNCALLYLVGTNCLKITTRLFQHFQHDITGAVKSFMANRLMGNSHEQTHTGLFGDKLRLVTYKPILGFRQLAWKKKKKKKKNRVPPAQRARSPPACRFSLIISGRISDGPT